MALLVALSLLASVLVMGGTAAAAPTQIGTAAVSASTGTVQIEITPTTQSYFQSSLQYVLQAYVNGSATPQLTAQAVYGQVYTGNLQAVTQNVYTSVYWVYNVPSGYQASITQNAVYADEVGGTVYLSVYLSLETPPPNTSAAATTTTPTTTANVGTVSVSNGTAAVNVSSSAVQSIVQQAQSSNATQITLDASVPSSTSTSSSSASSATVQATQIAVPPAALTSLASVDKPVEVKSSDGGLTLPPAVVQQLSQTATAQGGSAQISLSAQSESDVSQTLSQAAAANPVANAGLQAAGGSVTFNVAVQSSSGTSTDVSEHLAAPVTIHVPMDTNKVTTTTAPLAGVYRLDPATNAWDYVGPCGAPAAACAGQVDPVSGTASVSRSSLSTYAVLLFNQTFADMTGNWAAGDVQIAAAHHIVDGMTPTTFGPDLTVTRAQFAAMIQRLLMLSTPSTSSAFSDVNAGDWYAGAVAAAAQAGIVNGFPDGTFQPNARITREQMATMITRAMKAGGDPATLTAAQGGELISGYPDSASVSSWARQSLAVAINENILQGEPSGLVPQGNATRAEAATMLKRLLVYFGAF